MQIYYTVINILQSDWCCQHSGIFHTNVSIVTIVLSLPMHATQSTSGVGEAAGDGGEATTCFVSGTLHFMSSEIIDMGIPRILRLKMHVAKIFLLINYSFSN